MNFISVFCYIKLFKGGFYIIYRIKQFYWNLAAHITYEDKNYINNYLNQKELNLFSKLSICEQKHSIKLAYDIEKNYNKKLNILNKPMLIKAALLHDIGKIECRVDILTKSVLVLLNKITKGKIKTLSNLKVIDVYFNHPKKGYYILKKYNTYPEEFLYIIKNHHSMILNPNPDLKLLQHFDNLN